MEKPPNFEDIFEKKERRGGPSDPVASFREAYEVVYKDSEKYDKFENHPMYIELARQSGQSNPANTSVPKRMNIKETFSAKRKKRCDEVFADYIGFMKLRAKSQYCTKVIIFCLLYRECLNQLKDKLNEEKKNLPSSVVLLPGAAFQDAEYSLYNNGEQMPDICNEFIAGYLEGWGSAVEAEEMKELTLHFCNWIFFNGYTCSLIQINQGSSKEPVKEESPSNHSNENAAVPVINEDKKANGEEVLEIRKKKEEGEKAGEQRKESGSASKEEALCGKLPNNGIAG